MKLSTLVTIPVVALALTTTFSNAFAQAKTREEVRQELIQAEDNGSRLVTDASYPVISPIYEQQVARMQARHALSGEGTGISGSSLSGSRVEKPDSESHSRPCVGPVSYCNPYFGG